jgi:hypothetical protein
VGRRRLVESSSLPKRAEGSSPCWYASVFDSSNSSRPPKAFWMSGAKVSVAAATFWQA